MRVKMRYAPRPSDAAEMFAIRDELADLMTRILDCDSPRHAPIYAAWAAADLCARAMADAPAHEAPRLEHPSQVRGRPEASDIARLSDLHRRAQKLNELLHPSAHASAPILAVALAIRATAAEWSGNSWIWREQKGV